MAALYNITLWLGIFSAILFSLLVFFYGKGDAMGGGGNVRTTFKGKAGFDDIVSKMTLVLGVSFMALMVLINIFGTAAARQLHK